MSRNLAITKLQLELESIQKSPCIGIERPEEQVLFHLKNGKVYTKTGDKWVPVNYKTPLFERLYNSFKSFFVKYK